MLSLSLLSSLGCAQMRPADVAPRPRPTALYFSSDSILNTGAIWPVVLTQMNGTTAPTSYLAATYGGNFIGTSLMHLADETWAYVNGSWQQQIRPTPLDAYHALILESGRNDANDVLNKTAYTNAWDKAIAQALKYFPRVIVSTCPRRATDDLTAWALSANDNMLAEGYWQLIKDVWAKWSVPSYDMFTDFQSLVTAGTYTVPQLMRDIWHPTMTTGANVINAAIAAKLNAYTPPAALASPTISGKVVNYLFGRPTAGTWTMMSGVNAVGPNNSPVTNLTTLVDQFPYAAGTGAKVTFPTTKAKQVWFHMMMKGTSGGSGVVYVDRGTVNEKSTAFNTTSVGLPNYPTNVLVGNTELSAGDHLVEVETTNASQVAVLGITVVGAD